MCYIFGNILRLRKSYYLCIWIPPPLLNHATDKMSATDLQIIQNKIYEVRSYRIMLDSDLAKLYQVETKVLKQAVRRNIDRFPPDFMFELSENEDNLLKNSLRSQIVTSNEPAKGGSRYMPFAFTEQGVAMLSSVLRSPMAITVNIAIMRAFVLLRQMVTGYNELLKRIEELEESTDAQLSEVYAALTKILSTPDPPPRRPIGFITGASRQSSS